MSRSHNAEGDGMTVQSPSYAPALALVTEEEIARAIRELPTKRSNDFNHVSTWLMKQCSKES
ncbi:hypothetical protein J6590_080042 [Homalodisca vitripennis]|nr:hypothetical protein J6590_080042 [Homalodisca vitripennis]